MTWEGLNERMFRYLGTPLQSKFTYKVQQNETEIDLNTVQRILMLQGSLSNALYILLIRTVSLCAKVPVMKE
jgi:hypothetical protein